jgi:soluble lytic murein transglycosylase-like protein
MKKSSRPFRNILARASTTALLLGIAMILVASGGSATAQVSSNPTEPVQPKTAAMLASSSPTTEGSDLLSGRAATAQTTADDYKTSLKALSALYQNEVQRLEEKNNQSKELYKDGLISRVELEGSDKALADARAKVEEIAKQMTSANQQPPANSANGGLDGAVSDRAWTTGNGRVDSLIRYYGNQNSVDPYLIYCLMSQESKFATSATSPKGAQGLMQLMPGTAARYGVTNPYDIGQSIMGGTRYLKDLLQMFNGRIDLALAGYNAGENAVIKHGYSVPPYQETRNYVRLIIARYGRKQTSNTPVL